MEGVLEAAPVPNACSQLSRTLTGANPTAEGYPLISKQEERCSLSKRNSVDTGVFVDRGGWRGSNPRSSLSPGHTSK